jgi:hypothetical protein
MRRSGVRLLSPAPEGKRLSAIVLSNISASRNLESLPCSHCVAGGTAFRTETNGLIIEETRDLPDSTMAVGID